MGNAPKIMDERQHETVKTLCAVMYLINLMLLAGMLFYRQFVLHQPTREFNDLALLMTFNALFFLGGVFYFVGFPFPKFRLKTLIMIYLGFVGLGLAATLIKYVVLMHTPWSWPLVWNKLGIIAAICGLLVLIYGLFAYLGYRRMEKAIDDEET